MTRRHHMLDHIRDLSSSYDCWLIRAAFTTHQARHGHGFQRRTASEMPGSHALQRKQSWAQTDGIMFLLQPTHAKQMHMPSVDHEVSGSVLQFVSRRVLPFSECSRKWWEPLQKYLWMKYWSFKKNAWASPGPSLQFVPLRSWGMPRTQRYNEPKRVLWQSTTRGSAST